MDLPNWFLTASPYIAVVAVVGCIFFAVLLFDTATEKRRRRAIKASRTFEKMGLDMIADLYEDYAVGDYSGIAENTAQMVRLLANNEMLAAKMFGAAKSLASYAAEHDPGKAAELRKILSGGDAASTPSAK